MRGTSPTGKVRKTTDLDFERAEYPSKYNDLIDKVSALRPGQSLQLYVKFGDDNSNTLELRGRTITGVDGSNPAKFSVLGGTGVFKNAKGEALEIMIRPNNSGAFNFELDFSELRNVPVGKLKKLINGD